MHTRLLHLGLALLSGLFCNLALAQEPLRLGAEDDWYPYTAYRDGKVQGMSVDIVKAAFAASDTEITLVPYPYSRCMQMTREGQLAACFNTAPNTLIESQFLHPEEPLFDAEIMLWAKRPTAHILDLPQQLAGRRVAMTSGYEYGPLLDDDQKVVKVSVRRDLSGFLMLLRGRVEFVAAYRDTAEALFREHPDLQGQFEPVATVHRPKLYLSLSRQHPDAARLLEHFDQGMRQIRRDGRYQQILQQWQHHNLNAD